MSKDNDFDEWWSKIPIDDFYGINSLHVEMAFEAGRKAEAKNKLQPIAVDNLKECAKARGK